MRCLAADAFVAVASILSAMVMFCVVGVLAHVLRRRHLSKKPYTPSPSPATSPPRTRGHARQDSRSFLLAFARREDDVVSVRSTSSSFAAPLILDVLEPGKPPRVFSLRGRSFDEVAREARAATVMSIDDYFEKERLV